MNVSALLWTLLSRFLLLLFMILYAIPLLIIWILPKSWLYESRIFFWMCDIFYRFMVRFSFLPITYSGLENLPDEPAVIVANHQSSMDIPLVGKALHRHPHIWLAKSELLESPILRYILPRVAVIVDMSTPQKGVRSLIQTINILNGTNCHAIIFPEGTRRTDGQVHDFFGGFVILAKKTGRPVIPMRIFGVNKAYPPDTFIVNYVPIKVVIGPKFVYHEGDTDEAFKERVYNWFLEQKEE